MEPNIPSRLYLQNSQCKHLDILREQWNTYYAVCDLHSTGLRTGMPLLGQALSELQSDIKWVRNCSGNRKLS